MNSSTPDYPSHTLPPKPTKARTHLRCEGEGPRDVNSGGYAGSYLSVGIDDTFDLDEWKQKFKIKIMFNEHSKLVLTMKGVDVSVANALRRIMIAEVPTMAIETVQVWQNTGVIQDEVLALRLGLTPFRIKPELYQVHKEDEDLTPQNSIKFKLHVKCTERDLATSQLTYKPVTSGDLVWEPISPSELHLAERVAAIKARQHKSEEMIELSELSEDDRDLMDQLPRPVMDDVLITKLRPGQEIELYAYCEKGIGQTHAKWSPVSPVTYRLMPSFEFPEGPLDESEAAELVSLCPMKVFDIEDVGTGTATTRGVPLRTAVASRPLNCTTCRACLERFPNRVKLYKEKNHIIFTVHSSGCISAAQIFKVSHSVTLGLV
eukprot:GHVN01091745.1.p1 GENE.GHVN01091745.1~~GHVN01091745.1.p1  ORF type:complete len:376 (-),score=68.21 GHVN01091745.1:74-1201(-)